MAAAGDASSAAAAAAAGGMDEAGDAPPSIEYEHEVFGLAFHPQAPVVAAGLISGTIHLYAAPRRRHNSDAPAPAPLVG